MNPNDISEQSKSDKHINLLNFNNLVRGVKELLGMTYCREHFEFLGTGTSRTLRVKFPETGDDDYPFKCSETGTQDLMRFRRPYWDRNTMTGTAYTNGLIPSGDGDASIDLTSFASAGGTFWVRASIQVEATPDPDNNYSELFPESNAGAPFTASLQVTTTPPTSEVAYGLDVWKYIVEFHAENSHVTDWLQIQRGGIQDHLAAPDNDWRGTEPGQTIEYRDGSGVAANRPQHKVLSLRGAHTDAMVPRGSVKIPIVVRDDTTAKPSHVRYFMFDTNSSYNTGYYNFRSLEIDPIGYWPPNDSGPSIGQIRNFEAGAPADFASTDLVCVRHDAGGGVFDVSWPTVTDLVETGFSGGWGGGGTTSPWGTGTVPIEHHLLTGLVAYDDHNGGAAFYLQLGTDNTYARNTANSGIIKMGSAVHVEENLQIDGLGDVGDSPSSFYSKGGGKFDANLRVGNMASLGVMLADTNEAGLFVNGSVTVKVAGSVGVYSTDDINTDTDLNAGGALDVGTDANIGDDIDIGGDASITGSATITGNVTANSGSIVTDMVVGDDLDVLGDVLVSGSAVVTGLVKTAGADYWQSTHQGANLATDFYLFDSTGTVSVGGPYKLRGGIICVD